MKKSLIALLLSISLVAFATIPGITQATAEDPAVLSGGEIKVMSVQEVSDFYKISATDYAAKLGELLKANVSTADELQRLHDNLGLEPSAANDLAQSLVSGSAVSPEQVVEEKIQEKAAEVASPAKNYYVWEIGLAILALYATTWALARKKIIKPGLHRKLWNWVLLLSVVPAIFFGLMLAIKVTYGIGFNVPFSLTYWHVMGGVVMSVISLLHVVNHTGYFLPRKKK